MALRKIHIEVIGEILESVIKSIPLFSYYLLLKENIQEINSPTKIVNYDFIFTSDKYNRWLFIRIEDFYTHQNLIVWLNELKYNRNSNIDINNYFISKLKNKSINQKMIFKVNSEKKLEIELKKRFKYIVEQMDENLKKVILGEAWIDMPMNWGDYK